MARSSLSKPYLLSIGWGTPAFGTWNHRYFHVRKRHRGRKSFLGFHVVWTTYKRVEDGSQASH